MLDIILKLFSTITPFLILVMGWIYASAIRKRDKREDENKKSEERKEEERNKLIESQNNKIDDLTKEISSMKTVMEESHKIDIQTNRKISDLARNGDMTITNVSNLAELVMTLAEGLRDQRLDGNITSAVEKYRKYESNTLQNMVHSSYANTQDDGISN